MVTKVNPVYDVTLPRSFVGKSISAFDIDLNVDASSSTAPGEVLDSVIKTISLRATPVMVSDLTGTGQLMTVFVEGDFPDSDYDGDGSDESFAAVMQADIQALGTVDSLDLGSATVTAGTVYQADQTNT